MIFTIKRTIGLAKRYCRIAWRHIASRSTLKPDLEHLIYSGSSLKYVARKFNPLSGRSVKRLYAAFENLNRSDASKLDGYSNEVGSLFVPATYDLALHFSIFYEGARALSDVHKIHQLVSNFERCNELLENTEEVRRRLSILLISNCPGEKLAGYLERIHFHPSQCSEHLLCKIFQKLSESKQVDDFRIFLEKVNVNDLGPVARLKIELFVRSMSDDKNSVKKLTENFLKLNFDISKTFGVLSESAYQPDRFKTARFCGKSRGFIREYILRSLEEMRALSYVRLGDGECYGFGENEFVDCAGIERQEKHWWGHVVDLPVRKELQERFILSISKANIIGVPTVSRLIRDMNLVKMDKYDKNTLIARIFSVMKEYRRYCKAEVVTEDQSNLFLFDRDYLKKLASVAKKVVVVAGVKRSLIPNELFGKKLVVIEIPTHRLLAGTYIGSEVAGTLPEQYSEILPRIAQESSPGVLVIVSAGFIGKVFVAEAASHGAVALDYGQQIINTLSQYNEK